MGLTPMRPRDPTEPGRVSSSLELFFDLTFAVAVAVAAEQLLVLERTGHLLPAALAFAAVFFGIWWAWMNFSWFASAFDTDDWLYRLLTFVQMAGVLVFAAGIEAAMQHFDFRLGTAGYLIMRLAGVSQWLRAARDPGLRATALRYAAGITLVQVGWLARLAVPEPYSVASFLVLVAAELAVPLWAQRASTTPFHPRHITERYGLFTLIVLGEGLLAVTHAVIVASRVADRLAPLLTLAGAAFVLIAGMWWIYFAREQHENLTSVRASFSFGYLHYGVFAAAAAVPAGIELSLEQGSSPPLPQLVAQAAATVPVALFLAGVWILALRPSLGARLSAVVVVLIPAVAASALLPFGIEVAAVLVTLLVVLLEVDARRGQGRQERTAETTVSRP